LIVIPAIDIKAGRCVRLQQGLMSKETIYSNAPEEMARKWFEEGAERLHVVDLDGAAAGIPVNRAPIERILATVPIPIQLGGGIRDLATVAAYLELGVHRVILGTVAYANPDLAVAACERFPGRISLGIDARGGRIAVEGWTKQTDETPLSMANRFEAVGISEIVYTDIQRDGMKTGPNIESTKALAMSVKTPIIASGGISQIDDVADLAPLEEYGVIGVITGKALYDGTLDLAKAIRLAKSQK
jgi:phosphoribosylformimino-5-aminoimidazole carboxamide ribotide isomerase